MSYSVSYANHAQHKCGVGGSGGSPVTTPPSGMLLWLAGADIPGTNGAAISSWPDSSGNGLNATAAGAQRPTKQSASTINGKPAAAFDNTQQQFFDLPTGFADFTAGLELYIVHAPVDDFAQGLALLGLSNNAIDSAFTFLIDTSNDATGMIALQPGATILAATGVQPYAPCILNCRIPAGAAGSAVTGNVLLNGSSIASGAFVVPNNTARNLNFVGNDAIPGVDKYEGLIAEVILYATTLTAPQRAQVAAYLFNRYGI